MRSVTCSGDLRNLGVPVQNILGTLLWRKWTTEIIVFQKIGFVFAVTLVSNEAVKLNAPHSHHPILWLRNLLHTFVDANGDARRSFEISAHDESSCTASMQSTVIGMHNSAVPWRLSLSQLSKPAYCWSLCRQQILPHRRETTSELRFKTCPWNHWIRHWLSVLLSATFSWKLRMDRSNSNFSTWHKIKRQKRISQKSLNTVNYCISMVV